MRIAQIGLFALVLTPLQGVAWPAAAQTTDAIPAATAAAAATAATAAAVVAAQAPADPAVENQPHLGPETGFPLPRYVSLRAGEANARRGPSRSHRIDWVFARRNMPLMVVAEYGHWRRVVDQDGAGGWMHYSLLSGERTAIVEVPMLPIYARPDVTSTLRATAEMGVTGALSQCRPGWCLMEVGGYRGWVDANAIWGVDPGETFD